MIRSAFVAARRALLVTLSTVAAGALSAAPAPAANSVELEKEAKFLTVAWRLTRSNAPYCANNWTAIGIKLQNLSSPSSKDTFTVQVIAVAADSPAEQAGLAAVHEVIAIDEFGLDGGARLALDAEPGPFDLNREIERRLDQHKTVTIAWEGPTGVREEASIAAQSVCPSRFLTRDGKKIGADGVNVRFGLEFPAFDYPEDEFAAAVAHELAHNLMGHPYWLDQEGRKRSRIRLTEREADRLMPWLLANAGYDPAAAKRFMERWGPRHGGGLLRKRTHDGWDERVELIEAELARIAPVWQANGNADWRAHFRREEGL